jgi:NAD(P)H-hydrate epimerase
LLSPYTLPSSDLPPLILTPHAGEFLRLLGTDDKNALADRVEVARTFAAEHGVILVLKGERVVIADPNGKVVINPTGNSGLGKAGNGDTLAGVIAGFVAQAERADVDIFDTVVTAVYIAGLAGDIAERKFGKRVMSASDTAEALAECFNLFNE